jgi:thiamine-monophosphate kinase
MREYEFIKVIKDIVDTELDIIGDDTAILQDSGTILTCDTLVEDTHFRLSNISPFELGYKAGAVNLSDIAASGGIPEYFLVALALPKNTDIDFIRDFYNGLMYIASQHKVKIIGGDLTRCPKLVITITATARATKNVSRKNAKVGQKIISTGNYGVSYTGLLLLEMAGKPVIDNDILNSIVARHNKPIPRLKEAQYFILNTDYDRYCMMDTSDGLADAVFQIAQKSNKRLHVYLDKIPVLPELFEIHHTMNINTYQAALYGGEDFELLFTCNPEDLDLFLNQKDFEYNEIGEIVEGEPGISLISENTIIELDEYLLEEESTFMHF